MAKAENEQAPKRGKRTGRPTENAQPKVRMALFMPSELAFKLRALAFEKQVSYSAVFNDLVRSMPEPDIQARLDELKGASKKYSRSDTVDVEKEPITCWMEPAMDAKVRAAAFAGRASNSKIASDLVRAAPAPKMSGG